MPWKDGAVSPSRARGLTTPNPCLRTREIPTGPPSWTARPDSHALSSTREAVGSSQPATRHPEGGGPGMLEEGPPDLRLIPVLSDQPGHQARDREQGGSRHRAPRPPGSWRRCRSRPGWSCRSGAHLPAPRAVAPGSLRGGVSWGSVAPGGSEDLVGVDHQGLAGVGHCLGVLAGGDACVGRARARAASNRVIASTRWAAVKILAISSVVKPGSTIRSRRRRSRRPPGRGRRTGTPGAPHRRPTGDERARRSAGTAPGWIMRFASSSEK